MDGIRTLIAAAVALGPMVGSAAAQDVQVFTSPAHHTQPQQTGIRSHAVDRAHHVSGSVVSVIERPVTVPAATVSRAISEQPVHPHLIEVRINKETIYLDPDRDYQRQNANRIDANHSILRAQRLARSLRAQSVITVSNPFADAPAEPAHPALDVMQMQPRLIIPAPPRREHQPQDSEPRQDGDPYLHLI